MKKLTTLFLILFLSGWVLADTSRSQKIQQVTQALDAVQDGSVWQARVEDYAGGFYLGNLYFQYPAKYRLNYDHNRHYYCVDGNVTAFQGSNKVNSYKLEGEALWNLFGGKVGKNVEIQMVDNEVIDYYGQALNVVVADLYSVTEKGDVARLRVYVDVQGTPKLLGYATSSTNGFGRVWLRDLHQITPKKNLFERSVL